MRAAAAAPSRVEKWFSHLKIVVAEQRRRRAAQQEAA